MRINLWVLMTIVILVVGMTGCVDDEEERKSITASNSGSYGGWTPKDIPVTFPVNNTGLSWLYVAIALNNENSDGIVVELYDETAGEVISYESVRSSKDNAVASVHGTLDWDHEYELRISTENGTGIEFFASWTQTYSYYV